ARMTTTGAILGALAIASDRSLQRPRVGPRDLGLGLGIAVGLYGIFRLGDGIARNLLPAGDSNIGAIYQLRELAPRGEIARRLAAIVGPAEELFWRGLIQRSAATRLGGLPAALAA